MQKRYATLLVMLALAVLSAQTATCQPTKPVPYFVEYLQENWVVLHLGAAMLPDQKSYLRYPHVPANKDEPQLVRDLGSALEDADLHVRKFDVSMQYRQGVNWASEFEKLKNVLEKYLGRLVPITPEQAAADCSDESMKSQSMGQFKFIETCQYSVDRTGLELTFDRELLQDNSTSSYISTDSEYGTKGTPANELADRLTKIEGVQGVFIRGNQLSVKKGSAVPWHPLKERMISETSQIFAEGKFNKAVRLETPSLIDNPFPEVSKVEIPGFGFAYKFIIVPRFRFRLYPGYYNGRIQIRGIPAIDH